MYARHTFILFTILISGGLTASCGSASSTTSASQGTTASSTGPSIDSAPAAATTDPATTDPATMSTQSIAPEPEAEATPLPQLKPLRSGKLYKAGRNVIGRSLLFTASVDGSLGFSVLGYFGVTLDRLGTELLVGVTDLTQARVFLDPAGDLGALDGPPALDGATTPAPQDFLAYFASLPGVVAGPVEDSELAGLPARSMTYTTGDVVGAQPCFGVDRGGCLLATYLPIGVVTTYWAGDSGTIYVLELDDRSIVVDVSDRAGASELATSLRIIE